MSWRRLLAVLIARNREFIRDRSALAWNILFPVLIIIGFAFAFSGDSIEQFKVGVKSSPATQAPTKLAFMDMRYIRFIEFQELDAAIPKIERHQLDMLLDLEGQRFWINDSSPKGYLLEKILRGAGGEIYSRALVSGQEIRYVDWLLPGVLGMNIMFSSLFGVGYVIVRYRKNGVLKRLRATPLSAFEFLAAQVVSRLWLIVLVAMLVYFGTDLLVGFRMHGSYLTLLLVLLVGTLSMISLGLIVAARMVNEEAANGLLNLMSWPMMLLSGVWFSLEGSPAVVQQFALLLPLTHITDAARAVMIDGAGLLDIGGRLLVLLAMTGLFMAIGARSFRWE